MALVLRRSNKQKIRIVHPATGDELWIQLYSRPGDPPIRDVRVAFTDPARNFEIYRPESEKDGAGVAPCPVSAPLARAAAM